jgi:hypothetical protein
MKRLTSIVLGIALSTVMGAASILASPLDPAPHPHPEIAQSVHEANHEVDKAWEIYHRAALGGTVASPALQADIEQHLHEARTLVTQAREAAERGDEGVVQSLVSQVKIHTAKAIEGSKEKKK